MEDVKGAYDVDTVHAYHTTVEATNTNKDVEG